MIHMVTGGHSFNDPSCKLKIVLDTLSRQIYQIIMRQPNDLIQLLVDWLDLSVCPFM